MQMHGTLELASKLHWVGLLCPFFIHSDTGGRESLPNTPSWEAIFLHDPAILKSTFQVAFPGKQVGQEPARPVSIHL
jgi:hypothetical protein